MDMRVTKNGWIEIYDEINKETKSRAFYNLKVVAEGETFIAVLLKSGKIEVYDKKLNFLCSQLFPDAQTIIANSRIVVKLKNGIIQFFDKKLNLQFTRNVA